ncbi:MULTISPECIES: site-specific integrase [unclassified Pseudoxanthomonas]|uniref:site-specific integrase n=1 Tax=unclassified Pseudoxanthomonas TaxID=2645906 RepID=UPI0008E844F3|nr:MULTISPECIES: site-specific integrase [unclassified Pseudoxanthomonas]PPJ44077.1 integrase [Pseudoxanthomonas sp. KAs_5_3]SFV27742.1 Phage integrase family protein [Pseudoxanthomonas sp. YR558]
MTNPYAKSLQAYIDKPSGSLVMEDLRIGRIRIGKLIVEGREAAYSAQDLINTACDRTARVRSGKHGTRYHDPLPVGSPARLLSVEIEDYAKHQKRRHLKVGTVEASTRTLNLLLLTSGDVPVSRIDHTHIERMWDLLRWAPPGLGTDPDLVGLSFDQLIARGRVLNVPGAARSTQDKHQRFLTAFFNRLMATRAILHSPMAAFGDIKKDLTRDPERSGANRGPFSDDELQKIFDPVVFTEWARKWPHRWWAPMIGLYTGARINEIAQLKVKDIVKEGDVWCIAIQQTVDADLARNEGQKSRQSLKGRSAIRRIPIHRALLDAGSLDFVDDIKACRHPRLFPHLSAGVNRATGETNARYSQGLLNQFSTYMKSLGFPKGIGFHGFRHILATYLKHRRVPDADVAALTGHTPRQDFPVLGQYNNSPNPFERTRQLEALEVFQPPVVLPRYKRGQFAKELGRGAKFYP